MPEVELIDVALTDDERQVLSSGLIEWGGPAHCTEEMAVALGFESVADLFETGARLADNIRNRKPLTVRDWARALLATEVVFASDLLGSGHDWAVTVGLDDQHTLRTLRNIQRRLAGHGVHGARPGTRPAGAR